MKTKKTMTRRTSIEGLRREGMVRREKRGRKVGRHSEEARQCRQGRPPGFNTEARPADRQY